MNKASAKTWRRAAVAAFPHTIPVLTGFLVLGMAYGILMQTKGYGVWWSVAMSAVAFCGSMQFAAITLLTTAFDPVQAFLLSLMVNARHFFYGISMLEKYNGAGRLKGIMIYTLCDETFSIVSSVQPPKNIEPRKFYLAISVFDYSYWVIGTFLGGMIGSMITFNTKGLDFVLTALFIVLFTEQLTNKDNRAPGIIGLICAAACLLLFGGSNMVIASMVMIVVILIVGRKKLCR